VRVELHLLDVPVRQLDLLLQRLRVVRGGLPVISSRLSEVTEVTTNSMPALGEAAVGEPV
jgi:hypothetical protein